METINDIKDFEEVTFKTFLTNYRIVIPMVQRDYAQGRKTDDVNRVRSRFLDAIKSCLTHNNEQMKLDFVYGEKDKVWSKTIPDKLEYIIITPLDGQQRLTTLFLLHWYASRKAKNITKDDFAFLKNFTYDIRPSSRDFCSNLNDFMLNNDKSISEQIIDQNWFQGEWHNDPTIISMLVMLDAIKDKFDDVNDLWTKLTGKEQRIIFYFLPLSENGLSDELYIKMNSRGKKLTQFEHFKAEYEALYERDSEEAMAINHKFDVEWADTLFEYRDSDNTIDKEWMRYFFYISHILCYQQSLPKSNDEFNLIKLLYKDNAKAEENKKFLEQAFDCWVDIRVKYHNIDNFFDKFLSDSTYVKNKVTTFKNIDQYRGKQNFFNACIKLYNPYANFSYGFSYGDFLFLYGIITYLINKSNIQEKDFIERLRILRNLIFNSDAGEIRGDSDYMEDLIWETNHLMITGEIRHPQRHGFNSFQESEEKSKMDIKNNMDPKELQMMYKFEDHPLIYGFVSGLGFDNLKMVDTFYSIFNNNSDYLLIHRAMISIKDYTQYDNNRYYMGNARRSTWAKMLHYSRNRQGFYDNTMSALHKLLELKQEGFSLENIIDNFINDQKSRQTYSWRYYFAKYSHMIHGTDGELTCDDNNDYEWITLNKHQFNGQHWKSFLYVLFNIIHQRIIENGINNKTIELANYGDKLSLFSPTSSVDILGNKYIYFINNESEDWLIPQNDEGIDQVDRIEMAVKKITSLIGIS